MASVTKKDPAYVKLVDRHVRGMFVDLNTGFGISGLDIVPFPEDEAQAEVARAQIRAGNIEEATEDEVNHFVEMEKDLLGHAGVEIVPGTETSTWQEGKVANAAEASRRSHEAARGLSTSATYAAEQKRRDAILEAQGGKTSGNEGSGSSGGDSASSEGSSGHDGGKSEGKGDKGTAKKD